MRRLNQISISHQTFLSQEQILHLSKLAAIELSPDEQESMRKEITDILTYVEKLQSVSSIGVIATSHVHGVTNFFRDDIANESFSKETLEKIAPDLLDGSFRVPRII